MNRLVTAGPQTIDSHTHLKHRAIRGGAFTFASQWTRFFLRILSTVVLSRLLIKDDFGLVAMVTAFTGLASLFADAGLTQAATRAKHLSREQATSLFWINLALAAAIAAVVAAASPLVALFYEGDQRLIPITIVASTTLVIAALGAQHQAMLQRELRFGRLAAVEIASQLVGTIAAISIAAIWHTYWALVAQLIVARLVSTVGSWVAAGWCPGLPRIAPGTRALVGVGGHLSGAEVLYYVQINSDSAILGRVAGPGPLGEYNRALALFMLPLTQVMVPFARVAVPLLSRLLDEPVRFARAYYRMASVVAIVTTPLIAILTVAGRDLIALALGPHFVEAGTVFQILALASWTAPVTSTVAWVTVARGDAKGLMARNAVRAVLFGTAFLIGARWGAIGVAWGYVAALHGTSIPLIWFALRGAPVSLSGLAKAARPGMLIGLAGALAMTVPAYALALPRPWVSLAVTLLTGVVVMGGIGWLWPLARREIREAINLVRSFRRRTSNAGVEFAAIARND